MGYHRKMREAVHKRKKRSIKRPTTENAKSIYSQCTRKVAYVSLRQAERVGLTIMQERNQQVRIYLCPICEAYHLTKSARIRDTI